MAVEDIPVRTLRHLSGDLSSVQKKVSFLKVPAAGKLQSRKARMMRRASSIAIDWRLNEKGSMIYDRVSYAVDMQSVDEVSHAKSDTGMPLDD